MRTIVATVLAAAAIIGPQPSLAKDFIYRCADGTRLTASFLGAASQDSRVVLALARPAIRLVLPQAMSADGGRYSDGKTEFWIKGKGATLTRRSRAATTCTTPSV